MMVIKVAEKKSISLKPVITNVNLSIHHFCLGNISEKFAVVESREVYFKGMCLIFQLITMLFINLTY